MASATAPPIPATRRLAVSAASPTRARTPPEIPAAFPDWLQHVVGLIPYTGLIAAVRGVALDGRPLSAFGPELAMAAGWLALLFVAANRAYRFVQ